MTDNELLEYVQKTATLMELSIFEEYLPQVVDNFKTISAIASLVLEFPIPEDIDSAPEFKP